MSKKVLISIIFSVFLIVSIFSSISYAEPIQVTEENLKTAINNLLASDLNGGKYSATVQGGNIAVSSNSKQYNIKYTLSGQPTFTYTTTVNSGTTYQDFEDMKEKLILPMAGYLAVANIQGLTVDECISYMSTLALTGSFNDFLVGDGDEKQSEYEEDKIQFVKGLFETKKTIKDNTVLGINSFVLTTELKDVTTDSCNIVSTVSVDTNANFASLKASNSGEDGQPSGSGATDNPSSDEQGEPASTPRIVKIDDTQSPKDIPQTGSNSGILVTVILGIIALAIISLINNKRYKDIK